METYLMDVFHEYGTSQSTNVSWSLSQPTYRVNPLICDDKDEKHANISKFVIQSLRVLEAVQAIDLSNKNLSGIIPKTLAGCRNFFSLDLSGNKLSGSIPAEALIQMSILSLTNLSRNDLNGQILEKLAELKHLSTLDLSKISWRA